MVKSPFVHTGKQRCYYLQKELIFLCVGSSLPPELVSSYTHLLALTSLSGAKAPQALFPGMF